MYGYGTGFEGWLSELRLANRSMHGSEALKQINHWSVWNFSYSMNDCSGENHTGTDIDRFRLQQAWLVCKEPLPTCGKNTAEFQRWEPAGCMCEQEDGSRSCISGFMSPDEVVFGAKPWAYWRLYDVLANGTVPDSSGNQFHGKFIGNQSTDYIVNVEERFVAFNGTSYIEFETPSNFNFGARNFAIEVLVRANVSSVFETIISMRSSCVFGNWWTLNLESNGNVTFAVDNSSTDPYDAVFVNSSIRDNRWHRILALRRAKHLDLFVDGVMQQRRVQQNVTTLLGSTIRIGASTCNNVSVATFANHLAQVAIYVDIDSPPHRLCDVSGAWPYVNTTSACNRASGLCSPAKGEQRCCAIEGCAACFPDYRSCNRNFTKQTTESSTTMSMLPTNSSMISRTTATVTAVQPTAFSHSNSNSLTLGAWIGIVVGVAIVSVLLTGLLSTCYWKRRTRREQNEGKTSHTDTTLSTVSRGKERKYCLFCLRFYCLCWRMVVNAKIMIVFQTHQTLLRMQRMTISMRVRLYHLTIQCQKICDSRMKFLYWEVVEC